MTRNQLMKGGVIFVWINKQHLAYNTFRNCLLAPAVVGHFDEDAEMESHPNTSNVSLGAVLVGTVKKKRALSVSLPMQALLHHLHRKIILLLKKNA